MFKLLNVLLNYFKVFKNVFKFLKVCLRSFGVRGKADQKPTRKTNKNNGKQQNVISDVVQVCCYICVSISSCFTL